MGEEVAEGDIGAAGWSLDPEGLEVVVDRVVELEAAVLVQLHQTYGGQGLGDRGDPEHGVGSDGAALAPVGHPQALDGGLLARPGHTDGHTPEAVVAGRLDQHEPQV